MGVYDGPKKGMPDGNLRPVGYQQITSMSAAGGLTVPAGSGAKAALIQAETQDVRWRDDGTDPTGTVGMLLATGAPFLYVGDLTVVKFIETAASAKLNISYYG